MNKFLLAIIISFVLPILPAIADITYPYSLEYLDSYEGGKLFVADNTDETKNTADCEPMFYFVKTSWITDNETIYYWKGVNRKTSKGVSVGNAYIIDAAYNKNKLWLVLKDGNSLYITTFDTSFSENKYLLGDNNSAFNKIRFLSNTRTDGLFILNENKLYEVQLQNNEYVVTLINDKIIDCNFFESREDYNIAYIEDRNDFGMINFLNKNGQESNVARIPITENTKIFPLRNYLAVANSTNSKSDALISVIDINTKNIITSDWLKITPSFISSDISSNSLFAITNENNYFTISKIPILNLSNKSEWKSVNLPVNLCTPLKITTIGSMIYIVFSNALLIFDNELNEILYDYYDFSSLASLDFTINSEQDNIIFSAANGSLVLRKTANNLWFVNRQINNSYRFAVPFVLILLLFILYRKYRNQKRIFDALIDLPFAGFVFFINRAGKLIKTNEGGKHLLEITDNISLRKQFIYYCNTEHTRQVAELVERGLIGRITFQQKINIVEQNIPREWLCSLIPLRNITGRFRGVILTGIDITEELERQMLTNWAQLAHDMQTNLSTIRLNVEQIEPQNEDEAQRKSKILHQCSILVHRVRDIVTVGRDDKLEKSTVNSVDFCNEIRNEFDDNIFSKIQFKMELANFNFVCDNPKLLRAVRNAVENGIKYMKDKGGTITISCSKDIHNINISIKDTGVGMDELTKNKIFTPFFSTARKDGGYGIGTMIMQRVAELHGGKLLIDSQIGIGTEIIFQIPDLNRYKT